MERNYTSLHHASLCLGPKGPYYHYCYYFHYYCCSDTTGSSITNAIATAANMTMTIVANICDDVLPLVSMNRNILLAALHMLPKQLSEGYCSLLEGQTRLALVLHCKMDFSARLIDYHISKAVIKSQKQYSYDEADELCHSQTQL